MSWNKGFTKQTHPSLLKTAQTMKEKGIDNFSKWREQQKVLGNIPSSYAPLPHSAELAEFIGVVLGDGNISTFPRTERLIIVSNSNNLGFINRYAALVKQLFNKDPVVTPIKNTNGTRISFYQKMISQRLGIPTGSRANIIFPLPEWIKDNQIYLISMLKGLFEAEGSLSIHLPTSTYNFEFRNNNPSLLKIVQEELTTLGFHPEIRSYAIRLRKRQEVVKFKELISFRDY